ncbi:MAG: UDP-N-acetylmuramoyl-L-alanyl-D-glutamate--2,6-diaminopimelate ligase [Spirochaetaceae bacterium]|jgi:UDP-N-acetylmuramoyl-L-alanyl-D-glutamate--2,6-diaminopimelate ligase|nr:UDP-N-acetylmuramoyl-L-alanyl-D-glutamate--2,6-diaminopimelate ligase [Spirochaetaceae bacterium]
MGYFDTNKQYWDRVSGMEYDSRKIQPGNIYFALPGIHTDGSLYIKDAIERGALVVVCETNVDTLKYDHKYSDVLFIKVKDVRLAMSSISAAFYDNPSGKLVCIGVTGTEGKSTTVFLIWQLLRLLGKKAGFISTVQSSNGSSALDNSEHQTTPEATVIHGKLHEMHKNGCNYAVIEASSHGLSHRTGRLADIKFHAGVMTNVRHEHLEFHGTWEQYRSDKANLFRATSGFGVVNADDESADYFAKALAEGKPADKAPPCFRFSTESKEADASLATIHGVNFEENLPGAFNAGNVLAALITVSRLVQMPVENLVSLVPELKPVKGRMTRIEKGQPFQLVVDYAHTPSSFKTIFPPIREQLDKANKEDPASPPRRIITVFGSAGERDTEKRPQQGAIAAKYCDILYITDEDPRGEVPLDICRAIAKGAMAEKKTLIENDNLFLIPDRPAAIRAAFKQAKEGDIVLLLGKGHENSIIYKDHTMPYDEISEAEKALADMGYK